MIRLILENIKRLGRRGEEKYNTFAYGSGENIKKEMFWKNKKNS
ncbi:MAG: hypothetical protein ACE5K0_08675 [Candidatus Methanofastidiosia archaeon]